MRFKIDRARDIVGSKFTVFALFYFVFVGNFLSTSPRGAYNWRGDLTEGFCITGLGGLYLEGLIHGGAYFRNFTVSTLFVVLVYCILQLVCLSRATGSPKYKQPITILRDTINQSTSQTFTRALVFVTLALVSAAQPFFGSSRNSPPHWSVA